MSASPRIKIFLSLRLRLCFSRCNHHGDGDAFCIYICIFSIHGIMDNVNTRVNFPFSNWTWTPSLGIQLLDSSTTLEKLNVLEYCEVVYYRISRVADLNKIDRFASCENIDLDPRHCLYQPPPPHPPPPSHKNKNKHSPPPTPLNYKGPFDYIVSSRLSVTVGQTALVFSFTRPLFRSSTSTESLEQADIA